MPVSIRHLSPVSRNKVIGRPSVSKVAKGSEAADEADLLTETILVKLDGRDYSKSSEVLFNTQQRCSTIKAPTLA